jgi:hypothetical protein
MVALPDRESPNGESLRHLGRSQTALAFHFVLSVPSCSTEWCWLRADNVGPALRASLGGRGAARRLRQVKPHGTDAFERNRPVRCCAHLDAISAKAYP